MTTTLYPSLRSLFENGRIPQDLSAPQFNMLDNLNTLEDVARWALANNAETRAWWDEQRRANEDLRRDLRTEIARLESRQNHHSMRITALERKLFWLAGAAAAAGGVLGQAAGHLMG